MYTVPVMQGLATISSMLTDELESENSDPPPEAKLTSLFPPPPVLSIHLVIIGPLFGEYLKNKKDRCNHRRRMCEAYFANHIWDLFWDLNVLGQKNIVFVEKNQILKTMEEGLTVPRWVLKFGRKYRKYPKIFRPNLSAQVQKLGFSKISSLWVSVVRGVYHMCYF